MILSTTKTIREASWYNLPMDKDVTEAISRKVQFEKTEKNIGDATLQGLLIQAVRVQTRETKELSKGSNVLQSKIFWLTVAIVVLTVILVIIGIVSLIKLQ